MQVIPRGEAGARCQPLADDSGPHMLALDKPAPAATGGEEGAEGEIEGVRLRCECGCGEGGGHGWEGGRE